MKKRSLTNKTSFFFFSFLFLLLLLVIISKKNTPAKDPAIPERVVTFSQEWQSLPLPFAMAKIQFYAFPEHTCSIENYGAKGDGTTLNTQAIANAIYDCTNQGGGTVRIPVGRFLTGPIRLESNVRLDIAEGAELLFSQTFTNYLPPVFSRYEGIELYNYSPLISARDCHNVAITGKGRINGNGQAWWRLKNRQLFGTKKLYQMSEAGIPSEQRIFGTERDGLRPALIEFVHCSNIELSSLTIINGPMWTIHPLYSDTILIRDITITTEGPNTDGIVIDSSRNALINNVTLNTGDDAIVIKSGADQDGRRVGIPSENIVITHCTVGQGNGGVVIGSEMSGDVRNVFVYHCHFDGTKRGLRIKSTSGRGGIVENIWMQNITMDNILNEAIFLDMLYESKNVIRSKETVLPLFRNIFFQNITCSQANDALIVAGTNTGTIENLSFNTISLHTKNGAILNNIRGLNLRDFSLETKNAPLLSLSNVQDAFLGNPTSFPSSKTFLSIEGKETSNIHLDTLYTPKKIRLGKDVSSKAISYE